MTSTSHQAGTSPYEREVAQLIDEYRNRLEQELRERGVTRQAHKLQVDLAWLEERLAAYRRGVAWFRIPRPAKSEH